MIKFKVKKSDKLYDLAYDFLSVMKKRIEAEIQQENEEKRKNSYFLSVMKKRIEAEIQQENEEKRKNSYANLVDRITLKEVKNLIG